MSHKLQKTFEVFRSRNRSKSLTPLITTCQSYKTKYRHTSHVYNWEIYKLSTTYIQRHEKIVHIS